VRGYSFYPLTWRFTVSIALPNHDAVRAHSPELRRRMNDYSVVGRAKLEQQASSTLDFIRCPLDSAAMLVTKCVAIRYERGETSCREFGGIPRGVEWTVESLSLECSACRRRSDDIQVNRAKEDALAPR